MIYFTLMHKYNIFIKNIIHEKIHLYLCNSIYSRRWL